MSGDLVVISGVAGMTGSQTARQLLEAGASVVGFDNFFASSEQAIRDLRGHPEFTFFQYDIGDAARMESLRRHLVGSRGARKLSFVNCAAVVHTRHFYAPSATFDVNVLGMRSFLQLALGLGAANYLNCSTSEVYSLRSFVEGGVRESDLLGLATAETSQRTSYAAGKLLTEFFMREAVEQGKIKGCSLRFANVYGPDEEMAAHIIPYAIDSLLKSNEITLLENARESYRTFLHNRDSCGAVLALLANDAALDGSVYNVGTDEEIGMVDLVRRVALQLGRSDPSIRFEGTRSADPPRRLLNTEKLRSRTGWAPKVGLDQGIRECVEARRRRGSHG